MMHCGYLSVRFIILYAFLNVEKFHNILKNKYMRLAQFLLVLEKKYMRLAQFLFEQNKTNQSGGPPISCQLSQCFIKLK